MFAVWVCLIFDYFLHCAVADLAYSLICIVLCIAILIQYAYSHICGTMVSICNSQSHDSYVTGFEKSTFNTQL